jgi:hypothetical protein
VGDGCVAFQPALLREEEFLVSPATFSFVGADGESRTLDLDAGQLAFTYCAAPVVYRHAERLTVRVVMADGRTEEAPDGMLSREVSQAIFGRTGAVARIDVDAPPAR